jgi:hypothetical protein
VLFSFFFVSIDVVVLDIFLKVPVEKHHDWLQWSPQKGAVSLPGLCGTLQG